LFDAYAQRLIDANINMTVPYYLMASYAYYVEDDPIFTDAFYDNLAKTILDNWDAITHWHKEHLSKDDLEAGSFLGDYPSIVQGALKSLREQPKTVDKPKKQPKKPAPTDTMGAFGTALFDWGK
jgi:hypothetical protein